MSHISLVLVQNDLPLENTRALLRRLSSPTSGKVHIEPVSERSYLVGFRNEEVAKQFVGIIAGHRIPFINVAPDKLDGSHSTGSAALDQAIVNAVGSLLPRAATTRQRRFSD